MTSDFNRYQHINYAFLILFLSHSLCLRAQQSEINGYVTLFNSKTNTGKKILIANAQVQDDLNKCQPTVTNSLGQFQLVYVGVNEKESVSFKVIKPGLQVVNIDALNAVAGQKDTIKISMANPDSINKYRLVLYNIGKSQGEKYLATLLYRKNQELIKLRNNSSIYSYKIIKLEQEIAELENSKKKLEDQAKNLASKYSIVNLDDASDIFRNAILLFEKGNLDSSQLILSQADYPSKIDSILLEESRENQLAKELDKRRQIKNTMKIEYSDGLQLKAELHQTRYEFDSASSCYKLLIKLDSTNGDFQFDYADMLTYLNQYEKAELYYLDAIKNFSINEKKYSLQIKDFKIANIKTNLGFLYQSLNEFNKSEITSTEALEIYKRLAVKNPSMETLVAHLETNLGNLYLDMEDLPKAEEKFLKAFAQLNKLSGPNPTAVESDLAVINQSLGRLYLRTKQFMKADTTLNRALKIYMKLATSNPEAYNGHLSSIKSNLGELYYTLNDLDTAELLYKDALGLIRKEYRRNIQTFEPDLGEVLYHLGTLYGKKKHYTLAQETLNEAYNVYSHLVKLFPKRYNGFMVLILNRLTNINIDLDSLEAAEKTCTMASDYYQELLNPNLKNQELLAEIQFNLGIIKLKKSNFTEAESFLQQALEIYKHISEATHFEFKDQEAEIELKLGDVYKYLNQLQNSEQYYLRALSIRESQAKKDSITYTGSLGSILNNLGTFYALQRTFEKAESSFLKAIGIRDTKKFFLNKSDLLVTAKYKQNLGRLYYDLKRYKLSDSMLIESLKMLKLCVDSSHNYLPEIRILSKSIILVYSNILDSLRYDTFELQNLSNVKNFESDLSEINHDDAALSQSLFDLNGKRAWYLIFARKFSEAERVATTILASDSSQQWVNTILAHSLLFQGKTKEAKEIYEVLIHLPNPMSNYYRHKCLADFIEFKNHGITTIDDVQVSELLQAN